LGLRPATERPYPGKFACGPSAGGDTARRIIQLLVSGPHGICGLPTENIAHEGSPMRLVLALLVSLAIAGSAPAQGLRDQTPEDLINSIYVHYVGKDASAETTFDWSRPPLVDNIFEPALARAVARDSKREQSIFGGDPFVNGQDYDVKSADVEPRAKTADRARINAKLVNMGQPQTISYDLVRTKSGWRIHDILWEGEKKTFRTYMKVK
jgi:hypothetical protein